VKRILIVEDDREINGLLAALLEAESYAAHSAYTGTEGLERFHAEPFDLVFLDIMLPFRSGDTVLREIRAASDTPVIVITAKDLTQTKVDLLRLGADDYITKPFDIDEVLARMEAVLRRCSRNPAAGRVLSWRDISMDCTAKRVTVSGQDVALTATEYAILALFLEHPAKIFSKRSLFESVSGQEYMSDDNTMNVHISNLRRKLGESGKFIETVYGMGYRLTRN